MMLHTDTGIHPTAVLVESKTGLPAETTWDSIQFIWTNDQVTEKKYYFNAVLVRTDTYTYTNGKLTSITKEIL